MQSMPLKKQPEGNNADALKQRLAAMHKFYSKGLGGVTCRVLMCADFYRQAIEKGQHLECDVPYWMAEAQQNLYLLKEAYAGIPFDRLRGDADYYPLFAANNALKMVENKLSETLAEKEPANIMARILELRNLLWIFRDWGAVYRARINSLFKQIHKIDGNENFRLELIDIDGANWGEISGV